MTKDIAMFFKTIKVIFFISFLVLSVILCAQNRHDRVKDSLALERAYFHNDTQFVKKLLNKWSKKSICNKKITYTEPINAAINIYNRFVNDFMNGQLVGMLHNRDNWFCRFVKSPYLFIKPNFQYIYVRTIPDSLRRDVLKIAKLAASSYPELFQNFDPAFTLSKIRKIADTIERIPFQIDTKFYKQLRDKYDILPILATEGHRKCLVNFWGYFDITNRYTGLFYNDPPAEEKKRRLDFLNSGLCSDEPAGKIKEFGGEMEIGSIYILDNIQYAVVSYSLMECYYVALYDLKRLADKSYIPISYWLSVT